MSRPIGTTILSHEITLKICKRLKRGSPFRAACAGIIGYTTFKSWMNETAEPYLSFQAQVKDAVAEGVEVLVASIHEAGFERGEDKRNWQAHAWILERRWPKLFGRRDRVDSNVKTEDVTGKEDPKVRAARFRSLAAALESGEEDE